MGQDKVVPHEAEGDQLHLGKGALFGEQLAELFLGPVVEDHAPLDDAGHGVDHGDGGVGGTEEAERAHGEGLFERTSSAMCSGVQMESASFGWSEDPESLGGCTLTPIRAFHPGIGVVQALNGRVRRTVQRRAALRSRLVP